MILPYCPAIFECGAIIEGVWRPRREGNYYIAESLRYRWPPQDRIQARPMRRFGHWTQGSAPQLSFPFPFLFFSPHSFKTLPQAVLFQMKCFGRNTGPSKQSKRATPTRPETSPTISSTLALWLYRVRNTRQFCTPVEQLEMKRNRDMGG